LAIDNFDGGTTTTIIRGFNIAGTDAEMKDIVETKVAMHKLIAIASDCTGDTHTGDRPTAGKNAENIFAWGDLRAQVKFEITAKVNLLRSAKGVATGYLGSFELGDTNSADKKSDIFDLLFVSGENTNMMNEELNSKSHNAVFQRLTNGPQSTFNELLVVHEEFACETTLTIVTSGDGFDCFGDGQDTTNGGQYGATQGYYATKINADGYYQHDWDSQVSDYNDPTDFINAGQPTTTQQECSAQVTSKCDERIIRVTDKRKCFNFHGTEAGQPLAQFSANITTRNQGKSIPTIYNLLDPTTGVCQKPSNDGLELESIIVTETIVLERLRLGTERVFPTEEIDVGSNGSPFENGLKPLHLSSFDDDATTQWACDTTNCTTDPYHVIYHDKDTNSNAGCKWRETDDQFATIAGKVETRGSDILTGCQDEESSDVGTCGSPLYVKGSCPSVEPHTASKFLYMPPKSFPHFYVYAMSTFTASFPKPDSQNLPSRSVTEKAIDASKITTTSTTPSRRLGSKKLLASKSKGGMQTFTKSVFVISDTHTLH